MAFVEVRARDVEEAIAAGLAELSIKRDEAEITVLQEPQKGFLGIGGQDALVKVEAKEQEKPRESRSRGRRRRKSKEKGPKQSSSQGRSGGQDRSKGSNQKPRGSQGKTKPSERSQRSRKDRGNKGVEKRDKKQMKDDRPKLSTDDQAPIVKEFLEGMLEVMNLEGTVVTSVEDDVIVASVEGDQTQALVGQRGSGINAIHEVTKTVLLRHSADVGRLRLDIAGYQERRREALSIYANQLIDQVVDEGGEIILEPMSAADRKVVHDAAAARDGVRSYSEGESPRRFVVLANTDGSGEEE